MSDYIAEETLSIFGGGTLTHTVGNITWPGSGTADSWQFQPYVQQYVHPSCCSGDVHVFGCAHAEKCKCGKARRKAEPPKCAHCGKEHA